MLQKNKVNTKLRYKQPGTSSTVCVATSLNPNLLKKLDNENLNDFGVIVGSTSTMILIFWSFISMFFK